MNILLQVMTVSEVARQFKVSEIGVRKACERAKEEGTSTWCRQSGVTWLILREEALRRWEPNGIPDGVRIAPDGSIYDL